MRCHAVSARLSVRICQPASVPSGVVSQISCVTDIPGWDALTKTEPVNCVPATELAIGGGFDVTPTDGESFELATMSDHEPVAATACVTCVMDRAVKMPSQPLSVP